ncbi:MAG: NAD(P)/FAD-dependent oxidoreductase [Candidatus Omnitrophica bacterium]|nr:NAD(P)/FAD-dependent oxidoreductase [Candidatus Omnitrophota bacterium]MBU4479001.1 NAD(P)/FAD-dependent oxidoreductase [Candidatus Omnitrophota bacterium]MCG2703796.1 NAD(P)/FAD-dependent oxidoreductase [Candidatus Omnitrophota bacterium]MCG2711295.1 NAD(P)/FAD-dependent oxidoreductase [Candidatus Omnitrophota bacterium]
MREKNNKKTAVVIGAGPAGLTAAYELLMKTDVKPVVYEMLSQVGGIARTIDYKSNKMDLGGHRFFSKSESIMEWWLDIMPLASANNSSNVPTDKNVMLIRDRISRILFSGKLFNYPLRFDSETFSGLGLKKISKIILSCLRAKAFPIQHERSLEDFFINRFGRELYDIFFKNYTEKVWGVSCKKMRPDWGECRVKGLTLFSVLEHAFTKCFGADKKGDVLQKKIKTSLIEKFLYPKLGSGQLWQKVADLIEEKGGSIFLNYKAVKVNYDNSRVHSITFDSVERKQSVVEEGDYFISSIPVRDLIASMNGGVSASVREVAEELIYRDFICVGILLKKLNIKNKEKGSNDNLISDNWIYIQEKNVSVGRIQIFNNWSPYMVKDKDTVWLGLEYFCRKGDKIWNMPENEMVEFALNELSLIGFIDKDDFLDAKIVKIEKAYPIHSGGYDNFHLIKNFTDKIENLFLVGRNGMHRYYNMDYAMLSAMEAVKNISENKKCKDNLWQLTL